MPSNEAQLRARLAQLQAKQDELTQFGNDFMAVLGGVEAQAIHPEEATMAMSGTRDRRGKDMSNLAKIGAGRQAAQAAGKEEGFFDAAGRSAAEGVSNMVAGLLRLGTDVAGGAKLAVTGQPIGGIRQMGGAISDLIGLGGTVGLAREQDQRSAIKGLLDAGQITPDMAQNLLQAGAGTVGAAALPTPTIDDVEDKFKTAIGIPTDPYERALWEQEFGTAANLGMLTGTLASTMAMFMATRKLPGVQTPKATLARTGTLSNIPTGGALAGGIFGGGVLGVGVDLYTNPEGDTIDRMMAAARGAGGMTLAAGIFRGRPYGIAARAMHKAELAKKYGKLGRLGMVFQTSPYITVGHMTQSGLIGATLGATTARNAGANPQEAMMAGVGEGLTWLAGDALITRLGGVGRLVRAKSQILQRATGMIQDMLTPPAAARLAIATQLGGAAVGGGALGAGIAEGLGQDPAAGMFTGALLSAGVFRPQHKFMSVFPKSVVRAIEEGNLAKVHADDLGTATAQILRAATEEVADELDDPVMAQILRHSVARGTQISQEERTLLAAINKLDIELTQLSPGEMLPNDPQALSQVLSKARQAGELRMRLHNLMKESFDDYDAMITAQGKNANERFAAMKLQNQAKDAIASQRAQHMRVVTEDVADAAEAGIVGRQQLRATFNTRFTTAAGDIGDNLTPAEIYREIGLATGETAEQARRRIGTSNVEGAIGDLAHLRASAGTPNKPLTTAVRRVEGTREELALTKRRIDGLTDDLRQMSIDSNQGTPLTPQKLRAVLKRAGGGSVTKEGPYWRAKFPFVGDIVDTIPAIVRKASQYLPEHKVGAAAFGPLAAGNMVFENKDGTDGAAFLPRAAIITGLALVGLTLTKGVPTQYKGMFRQMRRWLVDQNKRKPIVPQRILGRDVINKNAIVGREGIVTFYDDGVASAFTGKEGNIPTSRALRRAKGRAIVFSLHNHPPEQRLILKPLDERILRMEKNLKRKFTTEERITAATGLNIRNNIPSGQDLAVVTQLNKDADTIFLGILTPSETMNIYSYDNPLKGKRAKVKGFINKLFGGPTVGSNRRTEDAILQQVLDASQDIDTGILAAMGTRLGKTRKEIVDAPMLTIGEFANRFGHERAITLYHEVLRQVMPGLTIIRNATDDQVEAMIAQSIRAKALPTPSRALTNRMTETIANSDDVSFESKKIGERLANDPAYRKRIRDLLLGPQGAKPGDAVTPTVARAGAGTVKRILPESLNPQQAVAAPTLLVPMKEWAAKHGLDIDVVTDGGARSFNLNKDGETIASAISLTNLRREIVGLAKSQDDSFARVKMSSAAAASAAQGKGMTRDQHQFANSLTFFGGGTGAVLGGFSGAFLQNATALELNPYDDSSHYSWMAIGATLGLAAGMLVAAKAARLPLTAAAQKHMKFFATPDDKLLAPHVVQQMIGKSSSGKGKKGPTKEQFFRFPIAKQVEHAERRVADVANTRNISPEARKARYNATVAKFTPSHMTPTLLDQYERMVISGARAVGYTDQEAVTILQGVAVNLATPFTLRQAAKGRVNLTALAREYPANFDDVSVFEGIRSMVATAELISGREAPRPLASLTSNKANLKAMLSPDADEFKALNEVSRMADFDRRAVDANHQKMVMGGALPPEQFFRIGNKLSETPGKEETGKDLLLLHRTLMMTTENIRTEHDRDVVKLLNIFQGTTRDERGIVRQIMENAKVAEKALAENPVMYRRAMEFRELLNSWADRLKLDPDQRIEDYYPWIYNSRAIAEMRRNGKLPDTSSLYIPGGGGIAEYKIWRNLLSRTNNDPLGQIIEDPLEAGQIYLNGAVRKFHIDRLLAVYDGDFFRKLAKAEPFVAAEAAKWVQDVVGVPGIVQLKLMGTLQGMGLNLQALAARTGLNDNEFTQAVLDKYFLSGGAGTRFVNFARGAAFYSKIMGSFTSAIVNLSQMGNSGTDMSLSSMLIGGVPYTLRGIQGKVAGALEGTKLRRLSGFVDPNASGRKKVEVSKRIGVWSDSTKNILEQVSAREFMQRGSSAGIVLTSSLLGGLGSAAFLGDEDGRANAFYLGAAAGGGLALAPGASRIIRRSLLMARDASLSMFEGVEFVNRGVAAGASERTARLALKSRTSPGLRRALAVEEVADNTLIGAGAGAGVGVAGADDDESRLAAAGRGAARGAVIGLTVGLAGRKQGRTARVLKEIDFIKDNADSLPIRLILREQGEFTEQEVVRWYQRQVLDQTQFRFGKEARPRYLRNPVGAVAGALQSFTLNQMEFTGQRLGSFVRSYHNAVSEAGGSALGGAVSGKLDTRVFRYGMLTLASSSALAAMSSSLEIDKGFEYWLGRIGLGLFPIVTWNSAAEEWQLSPIGDHLEGPFISDVLAASRTIFHLATDPVALQKWDEQSDRLSRQIFSAMKQIESGPKVLGKALDAAGQEGLADMVREQQQAATNASRPFSTARQGQATVPRPGTSGGDTRQQDDFGGGSSTDGGGFGGGGGGGNGFGGDQ